MQVVGIAPLMQALRAWSPFLCCAHIANQRSSRISTARTVVTAPHLSRFHTASTRRSRWRPAARRQLISIRPLRRALAFDRHHRLELLDVREHDFLVHAKRRAAIWPPAQVINISKPCHPRDWSPVAHSDQGVMYPSRA